MQILTFSIVCGPNLHARAKFRPDPMNGCGYIMNFRFPIWQLSAILNCGNMLILSFRTIHSHNVHAYAKFHRDQLNGAEIFQIFDFQYGGRPTS